MVTSRLTWNGDDAFKRIREEAWQRILRAAIHFWKELKAVLNVLNPPPHTNSSRPGEPPRKRTGWLQRHVLYEPDKPNLVVTVGLGKNAIYGLWLELGTRRLAPRPWFMATLRKLLPTLQSFVGRTSA